MMEKKESPPEGKSGENHVLQALVRELGGLLGPGRKPSRPPRLFTSLIFHLIVPLFVYMSGEWHGCPRGSISCFKDPERPPSPWTLIPADHRKTRLNEDVAQQLSWKS